METTPYVKTIALLYENNSSTQLLEGLPEKFQEIPAHKGHKVLRVPLGTKSFHRDHALFLRKIEPWTKVDEDEERYLPGIQEENNFFNENKYNTDVLFYNEPSDPFVLFRQVEEWISSKLFDVPMANPDFDYLVADDDEVVTPDDLSKTEAYLIMLHLFSFILDNSWVPGASIGRDILSSYYKKSPSFLLLWNEFMTRNEENMISFRFLTLAELAHHLQISLPVQERAEILRLASVDVFDESAVEEAYSAWISRKGQTSCVYSRFDCLICNNKIFKGLMSSQENQIHGDFEKLKYQNPDPIMWSEVISGMSGRLNTEFRAIFPEILKKAKEPKMSQEEKEARIKAMMEQMEIRLRESMR